MQTPDEFIGNSQPCLLVSGRTQPLTRSPAHPLTRSPAFHVAGEGLMGNADHLQPLGVHVPLSLSAEVLGLRYQPTANAQPNA
ncbi:hypothetical protein B9Q06_07635 [Candidatus Marsarchaeota G2 archaeon ECH_B_2]|uniref:Uncharacterized protein n=3 Tax=Candidatus Marsarchaeota group 2 TaxID=2203771 RepID=A0A2R6B897_9ARCH|nr:MAG: hypothetical protein B9Q06_07635 [Candidatus Marsarchaeota G2 archaeon ECH_B_2]PSN99357.1 MAG: hypothetical protein B9Q07_07220 [Candidatus Marsarchaeota G2 archaeon ECH_B_3]PSO01661.1 MAG: hypothetical protein B9Q05_08105 [Candidatus Marsarchaeota G2 archaeon ECH_B_1]